MAIILSTYNKLNRFSTLKLQVAHCLLRIVRIYHSECYLCVYEQVFFFFPHHRNEMIHYIFINNTGEIYLRYCLRLIFLRRLTTFSPSPLSFLSEHPNPVISFSISLGQGRKGGQKYICDVMMSLLSTIMYGMYHGVLHLTLCNVQPKGCMCMVNFMFVQCSL